MRSPLCSIVTRSRTRRIVQVEDRREALRDRAGRRPRRRPPRRSAGSASRRKSFSANSSAAAGADADRGAAREGQRRPRRPAPACTQRRPHPIAAAEQDPRERDADDEHQQARVRHLVAERALRPLAQVVVVQDAVLHDAERRADAPRSDITTVSSVCRGVPVDEAGRRAARAGTARAACSRPRLARGSGENAADTSVIAAVGEQRPEKRAAPRTRSRRTTRSAIQQRSAIVSRICAMAIENWSAPATPNSASSAGLLEPIGQRCGVVERRRRADGFMRSSSRPARPDILSSSFDAGVAAGERALGAPSITCARRRSDVRQRKSPGAQTR